jgi:hypothetical protein
VEAQKPETKFVIRIENINKKVKKLHIERLISHFLKMAGHTDIPEAKDEGDFEKATKSKIVIDMDKQGKPMGQAWFQSTHRASAIEILKWHRKVWAGRVIRTFLMGFAYDDADADEEEDDIKVEREHLKGGQNEQEDLEDLVDDYIVNDEDEEEEEDNLEDLLMNKA